MATAKRPRKKTAKRAAKKKAAKKAAVTRFTATQKGTARERLRPDGTDGGVWVQVLPPTWIKYSSKVGINSKIKKAAVKALKKFRSG